MSEKLVEIKPALPGFDSFIGTWVCLDDLNIIVDVGPANAVNQLIESLVSLGLDKVDYVLLTHIHIDHAGGLADFLKHFPTAKVVCHEKAIKYLIDPSALWQGSRKILARIAEAYGPPKAVSKDRLIPHTQMHIKDLEAIETPGHAPHHISFRHKNRLFVGEAAGNYFIVKDKEYLRPATPPKFFLDVWLKSIDRLLALEDLLIFYPHFGRAESSHRLLKESRNQLIRWQEIIHKAYKNPLKTDDDPVTRSMYALLEKDPNLEAFGIMAQHTRKRESFFLKNSIKGFVGFLEERVWT